MKTIKLSDIRGSLSDYVEKGLPEPVVVTRNGKPLVAIMPLSETDDPDALSLTNEVKKLEEKQRALRAQSRAAEAERKATAPPPVPGKPAPAPSLPPRQRRRSR